MRYAPFSTHLPSSSTSPAGQGNRFPRLPRATTAQPAGERLLVLGETTYRRGYQRFGLLEGDRTRHLYVLGKTGSGKSTLLQNLIAQDLAAGASTAFGSTVVPAGSSPTETSTIQAPGLAVLDPHGSLADAALAQVPQSRIGDVLVIDPADEDWPLSFNVLREGKHQASDRALLASSLIAVFKKQWADSWGPRLEHVLRNALLAVAEHPDATLVMLYRFLTDEGLRDRLVERVTDPVVLQFWTREFAGYKGRLQSEATAPVLNKLGAFVTMPKVRAIVGQVRSRVNPGQLMDRGAIIIAKLSTGTIGEDAAHLLGGLLLSSLQLAAMRRNRPDRPFYIYIDEFQHFVTDSLATLLSESRKFGIGLTLAHQYLGQLPLPLRDAVLGNTGSLIVFRVGAEDAELLERELNPPFEATDLARQANYHVAVQLLARGAQLTPFSARTLPPTPTPAGAAQRIERIREQSRSRYCQPSSKVEHEIRKSLGV